MNQSKDLIALKQAVKEAKRITFLGGAGVSTASGILDFRSPKGLYNIQSKYGVSYEEMLSHSFFKKHPDVFYDFYWSTMVNRSAIPNKAHIALSEFGKKHPNFTIITQNIDGLDKEAGSKNVIEVHGTVKEYFCPNCLERYSLSDLETIGVPRCKRCGSIIKPKVVLYEEPLDEDDLLSAVDAIRMSDLLLIGGTSMNVYPIAALPSYFLGGKMAIINQEETKIDSQCDFVIHDDIGKVLSFILGD